MNIEKNYNIASKTFFGVGGEVDYYIELSDQDDCGGLVDKIDGFAEKEKLVIGACSNILLSDNGFDGIVIKNAIKGVDIQGLKIVVGAGEILPNLVFKVCNSGLQGIEHLGNIPGTVGGGIRGNVEAYGQSISDNLLSVNWWNFEGGCEEIKKDQCRFGYRDSIFKNYLLNKGMILSAIFELQRGDNKELMRVIVEDKARRMKSQPIERSCGCFFKNVTLTLKNIEKLTSMFGSDFVGDRGVGDRFSAGLLIDKVGLKGESVGGAIVSEKHANFLINYNNATAQDIYDLYKFVKRRVYEKIGIELENEVMIVGDFKE